MRDFSRTCLCPCTDIITCSLWWREVLCCGGWEEEYSTVVPDFIGNWLAIHYYEPQIWWRPSVAPSSAQLNLLYRQIDAFVHGKREEHHQTQLWSYFIWQKKISIWQYWRKNNLNYFTLGWRLGIQFHNFFSVDFSLFSLLLFLWGRGRPSVPKTSMGKQAGVAETTLLSNNSR